MKRSWFNLSENEKIDVLKIGAGRSGRPEHLLEKDILLIWILSKIRESKLYGKLTFKGGTSLSKVYKIIDRFSEDVDLTYDIREIIPDLLKSISVIPSNPSQEKKITSAVKQRLPEWIKSTVKPILQDAVNGIGMDAVLTVAGKDDDQLVLSYKPIAVGKGYSKPEILLEFGARSTGEPNTTHSVDCDISSAMPDIVFPATEVLVMDAERTFWEKATAAYVYSMQDRLRGDRFSRHWYDLAAFTSTPYYSAAINNYELAHSVAVHKSVFFSEKNSLGGKVNYFDAISGGLKLVPLGQGLNALRADYNLMLDEGLLSSVKQQPTFDEIMDKCKGIEDEANAIAHRNNDSDEFNESLFKPQKM